MRSITYFGINAEHEIRENPLAVEAVQRVHAHLPLSTIRVYTGERFDDDEPLEWMLNITSPSGRRSVILTQRVKGGAVLISNSPITT